MTSKTSKKVDVQQSPEFDLWDQMRNSTSYSKTIDLANEWLPEVWKSARQLGLASHNRVRFYNYPKIISSVYLPAKVVGSYWSHDMHKGPLIHVAPLMKIKMYYPHEPSHEVLLDVILHETRHALDDKYGIGDCNYTVEKFTPHNDKFYKRHDKMLELFPTVIYSQL